MIVTAPTPAVTSYRTEMETELSSLLEFWINNMVDGRQGGFYGKLDNNNQADPAAPKGIVLNSRILWTFSAAAGRYNEPACRQMASRAYRYIVDLFIDRKYGGVFWSVNPDGSMLDGRKQIYGLAFCLYGLTEYYRITQDEMALHLAENLFRSIEQYSFDSNNGGYLEAFTQGWKQAGDMRLSEKDANEKKSMNTHLHIIEAYANLYSVSRAGEVRQKIIHLLDVFDKYIIDPQTGHLRLFMTEDWEPKSSLVSYGHDIEAAWLLLECAEMTGEKDHINRFRDWSLRLADATVEGLDKDGGLWYEYDPDRKMLTPEKHSWPQAEAMVGFLNAFQLSGHQKYLQHSLDAWAFIKKHLRNETMGEWFWGVDASYIAMNKEKAGFWKCPYHSARACMEVARRLDLIQK